MSEPRLSTIVDRLGGSVVNQLRQFDWGELRDLAQSGRWPSAVHVMLCIGLGMLMLPVGEVFWLAEKRTAARFAFQQVHSLDTELIEAGRELEYLRVSELGQRRAELLMHNLYLHSSPPLSLTLVPDMLGCLAVSSGLTIEKLAPGSVDQGAELDTYWVDLGATGTLMAITAFVSGLGSLPVLAHVHDLQIGGEEADTIGGSTTVTVRMTVLLTGSRSGRLPSDAIPRLGAGYQSAGESWENSVSVDGAVTGGSQLEQLEPVGVLETPRRRVALFRDHRGDIYRQMTTTDNKELL
jgi:Tfp pilus assembly protein PilO